MIFAVKLPSPNITDKEEGKIKIRKVQYSLSKKAKEINKFDHQFP